MHGTIGFTSVPGAGATFYFELPIKHPASESDADFNQSPGAPRLLVVEDEPDISRLFAIILSNAGYNVDIAHNAETARQFLQQRHYDAMTLDLMLPDQSGINLIHQIRKQAGTEALPIIVISAYPNDGEFSLKGDYNLNAGNPIDWLEKPVNSGQLIAAINRALITSNAIKPHV